MKLLKNLAEASPEEQARFFGSFDHIFSDMDGVIWLAYKPLPGAVDFMNNLKKQGKNIRYVTNNSLISVENVYKILRKNQFDAEIDDVATPIRSGVAYLKNENFNKFIFAVGTNEFKEELKRAGFKVYPSPPQVIEESVPSLLNHLQDDENVGAVFFSFDPNLTFVKMQKMLTYLNRDDCLFLVAAGDKCVPAGKQVPIIGTYHSFQCLEDLSGRKPTSIAKPSKFFAEFIVQTFGISDPGRVLFIGDSIPEDMKIASIAGFQKLLVLTGVARKQDVENWQYPEDFKPEYYVESIDILNNILKSL